MKKSKKAKIKNYGFIPDRIKAEDYVLGGFTNLPTEPLRLDGQWDAFLPSDEFQSTEVESYACVSFAVLNACEILLKAQVITDNFSDRWLAWNSDTAPTGNSPQKVAETLRKGGVPKEEYWPITSDIETWDDFYKSPPPKLIELARKHFIEPYDVFGHEWVLADQASLKQGLKFSPLTVAVYGWLLGNNGLYYKPENYPYNHYVVLYGYEEGKYWKIFDTYEHTRKELEWNYPFVQIKRFHIQKKTNKIEAYKKTSPYWFSQIWRNFLNLWKLNPTF